MLGLSVAASADPQVISRAYELTLADFRPPATENGGVRFKACANCEFMTLQVGPGTRYTLDGRPIKLENLLKQIIRFRDRDAVFVGVLHHLESDTAQLIAVSSPE
jgi:hypothetical protein